MELEGEVNDVRGKVTSRVGLYQEESPWLLYEQEEAPVPNVRKLGLKKRKLSSLVISI